MIPKDYVTEWRDRAPWGLDAQVEQDLVISRALVDLFRDAALAGSVAFRGGTALYKLHLRPVARYSEDIDLVQVEPEPIGATLDRVRAALDPWLGPPRRLLKQGRVSLLYRFESEDAPPLTMRLKIEINTREHFTELGHVRRSFAVDTRWYRGDADITTFDLNELLGTKLRALYQRSKGRDLFDLWHGLASGLVDPALLVRCFLRYLAESGLHVSRAQLEENLAAKRRSDEFRRDVEPLLRPGTAWQPDAAMDSILERLVALVPGEAWKGG